MAAIPKTSRATDPRRDEDSDGADGREAGALAERIAAIVGDSALFRHRLVLAMVLEPPASARWHLPNRRR